MELSAAVFGFALACGLALLLTPIVLRAATHRGLRGRGRLGADPLRPQVGGLALLGALVPTTLALRFGFGDLGADTWSLLRGLVLAGSLIAILGFVDDVEGSRPWKKLVVQALALILLQLNCDVLGLSVLGNEPRFAWMLGAAAMVPWILGLTNAMNLIDGIDGLAAGIAAISGVGLASLAWAIGEPTPALPALIVVGASLGFLRSNRPPAKIIMGDTGSMFLGFVLAAVGARIFWSQPTSGTLLALFLICWVPCLDTAIAILRRLRSGRSIFVADQGHLHHRLLDFGLSHRHASLALCALGSIGAAAGVHVVQDRHPWIWAGVVLLATLPLAGLLVTPAGSAPTRARRNENPAQNRAA